MTRRARLPLAFALAALLASAPVSALAHDELTGTDPQDGEEVESPEAVTLTFSGEISDVGAAVEITGPGGSATDGEAEVDGTEVVQELVGDLPEGAYDVVWRVTSEDGHPIAGEFDFTVVGGDDGTEDVEASQEESQDADATDEDSPDASDSQPEETTSEQQTSADTEEPEAQDETAVAPATGLPGWAWAFVVVSALGLTGFLIYTIRRSRS